MAATPASCIGDTVPTITSMVEKGQPDIAPEGWIDLLPDVVNHGVKEGKLVERRRRRSPTAACRVGGFPKFIVDAHPGHQDNRRTR